MKSTTQHSQKIKDHVLKQGFDKVGLCAPQDVQSYAAYLNWVDKGFAGNMHYMAEQERKQKRQNVQKLMPKCQTVLMASISYKPKEENVQNYEAKIARYAWGKDYHKLLKKKLKQAMQTFMEEQELEFDYKIYVDTGPILERDYAVQAGLGWIGKNTCLIDTHLGSYTLLACVLLNLELMPDPPMLRQHCGTCTRCLDACPTDAFEAPYVLNANKCISYHTIENRDEDLPNNIAENLEGWMIGCDICQEVCPWNRKAPAHNKEAFIPKTHVGLSIQDIQNMDEASFKQHFAGTSLYRTGLKKIKMTAKSSKKF
ncbi:MAG TPA: tRNA epoxyqueuosine(34) reductase QueG [Oligoflexia bacterium]|nr:tRNA epoxyqueuosine(34) reductase QueG [Oligoflexia bacterium]HMR25097.1 tRNA epoxyqueuosine(34) reductase QueG [Oligoflexia bacterium]